MRYLSRTVFVFLLSLSIAIPAFASGKLVSGPRIGDEVDIISTSGIGTRHAVIKVNNTGEEKDLKDHIEGDCVSGWFTMLYPGMGRLRFLGKRKHPAEDGGAHYLIVSKFGPLNGTTVSSYGEALEQYNALCPGHADMTLDQ
jgi:hypothetical protein